MSRSSIRPVVPTPAVSLNSVVALAGRYPVLAGADFEVAEGEVVALTGPNGAGKTSLLRVVAGLLGIREGSAEVLGVDLVRRRSEVRSKVGFVGHSPFLYEELTVAENFRFFTRGAAPGTAALEELGLTARLDVTADRLSSGQRRRLGLAILVARAPRLWLLDEPHAGLDEASRRLLADILANAAALGTTVLFSAHDRTAVSEVAHRSVVVDGGVVTPDVMAGAHVG